MINDREHLKDDIENILRKHQGPDDCITMDEVYMAVTGEKFIVPWNRHSQTRIIRSIVNQLRMEGSPVGIVSGKGGGYFWARNMGELESTISKLRKSALTSLRTEAALKRLSTPDLLDQYKLELEQEENENGNP